MTKQQASAERRRPFGLALHPLGWGIAVAAVLVYVCVRVAGSDSLAPALLVFLPVAVLANILVGRARVRTAEADALARRQTALRRVATLVAGRADPSTVYPIAVDEVARGLAVEHVTLIEFAPGNQCVVLATHDESGRGNLSVGQRLSRDGDSVRIDDQGVGAPVNVNGKPMGALIVGSAHQGPLPAETESHLGDFADLLGSVIAIAETRAALQASRARVVVAADQARRDIERDLNDGPQQRVASLGLGLRALESSIRDDHVTVRKQIDNLVNGMADLYTELQELTRGIHPAILSRSGLGPAIKGLARRSTLPVRLDLAVDGRLSESVEVAGYYVIAEALDNVVRHAHANDVSVRTGIDGDELWLEVSDDGVGGASSAAGSGLIGLRDRVESISGRLDVVSAAGSGTTVTARIPIAAAS